MKCVILAGGRGTRISELTDKIPKPMIKIAGKPILYHIMKHYSKYLNYGGADIEGVTTLANTPGIESSIKTTIYDLLSDIDGKIYCTLIDTASGIGQDYSAFTIIDVSQIPYKVVAKYKNNENLIEVATQMFGKLLLH